MTTTTTDPFAGIRDRVPTRYAPGDTMTPYDYPEKPHPNRWFPVIYYPAGEVVEGEGPIWLVEPYPAARADRTDGLDEVDGAGVAVLRHTAAPRPRGTDRDGDWTVPRICRADESAYDVYVTSGRDLMAAWCEASAIAAALNNGLVKRLGLKPTDIEVLLAAERGALVGDSRFIGTINELRWTPISDDTHRVERVVARQAKRLRERPVMIEPATVTQKKPARAEFSSSGAPWAETTYRLSRAATTILAEIRRQYDGPTRCRVCGCTWERACEPGSCSWVEPDLCSSCPADDDAIPATVAD